MPRKTKQEKLRADTLRKSAPSPLTSALASHVDGQDIGLSYQFKSNTITTAAPSVRSPQTHTLGYIQQDLRKIILLAFVALASELMLYWYWEIYALH